MDCPTASTTLAQASLQSLPKLLSESMSRALLTMVHEPIYYKKFAERNDWCIIIEVNTSLIDMFVSADYPGGDGRPRLINSTHADYCYPSFQGYTSKPEFPRNLAIPAFMVQTPQVAGHTHMIIAQGFMYPVYDTLCLSFHTAPNRDWTGAFLFSVYEDQVATLANKQHADSQLEMLDFLRDEHLWPERYDHQIPITTKDMRVLQKNTPLKA